MESLRTVFVRSISASVTDQALREAFSVAGEVLQCFLLSAKEPKKKHKGCGFVEFGSAKGAKAAVEKLNGVDIEGKKIKVEIARPRTPFKDRKKRKIDEVKTAELKQSVTSLPGIFADPVVQIRTMAIGGVTPETSEGIKEKATELGDVEDVLFPAPKSLVTTAKLESDGCNGDVMLIAYKSVNDVTNGVSVLHGVDASSCSMPEGQGKKKKQRKNTEETSTEEVQLKTILWCRQLSGEGRHLDKHRVILRNLPFGVTAATLKKEMEPAGFVWKLDIAKKEDGKMKGFAFATFTSNSHAQKAKVLMDGKKLKGRKITAEMALPKNLYEKKKDEGGEKGSQSVNPYRTDLDVEESDRRVANVLASFIGDDHDSPPENSIGMTKGQIIQDIQTNDSAEDVDQDHESDSAGPDSDLTSELMEEPSSGDDGSTIPQSRNIGPKELPKKLQGSEKHAGGNAFVKRNVKKDSKLTVFIRGLPLDCPQHVLQAELERFGPLKNCMLVENKQTGKMKGTAFVEYVSQNDAEMALEHGKKASSGNGPGLFILGTPVHLSQAISSQEAERIAQDKSRRERPDKRNIYLAQEGRIEDGSLVWKGLSSKEKAQRARGMSVMKQKLKDPNCFLSKTRLMVRNLPKNMDGGMLGEVFCKAVLERAGNAKPELKHAIVLTDKEKGKSQCRGFVEFTEHDHALAALRQLNANPYVFTRESRPIIEFAVENIKKVRLHEMRVERRKERAAQIRDGIQPSMLTEALGKSAPQIPEKPQEIEVEGVKVLNQERKKQFLKSKWSKIRNRAQKSAERRQSQGVKTKNYSKPALDPAADGITKAASGRRKRERLQAKNAVHTVKKSPDIPIAPRDVMQSGRSKVKKGVCGEGHDRLDDIVMRYQSRIQGAVDRPHGSAASWFDH